jgi:hypothetical protein
MENEGDARNERIIYENNNFKPHILWITCEDIGSSLPNIWRYFIIYGDTVSNNALKYGFSDSQNSDLHSLIAPSDHCFSNDKVIN